ncbi:MAG TPA: sterol desaturase family protein [Myxococcota bacterium]|jgi:sterol desaturase/sphingolipid hydroxylase (fatty acid hydroxylase superfamily)
MTEAPGTPQAARGAPPLGLAPSLALYLGVVGATTALGGWALAARVNAGVVAGVGFFALCALFLALERWRPWRRAWLHGFSDLRVDLPLILLAAPAGLVVKGAEAAASRFGLGVWPTHWPLLAQAALALLLGDFVRYWFHRAEHSWLPLWRIHATHHSAQRLYCVNGPRLHPLEVALSGALQTAPLALLGASGDALALQVLLTLAIGRFQHCNLALTLGPLNYLFSAPDPHRWHHARDARTAQCNYGGDVLVWDHLFGTFFLPSGREPSDEIGIENGASFPRGILGVLASPFTWRGFRAPPA